MKIILIITFIFVPHDFSTKGWEPREAPTMKKCEERKEKVKNYLKQIAPEVEAIIECIEV